MPIYEYVCKSCGFEKDVLQKLSDEPLTRCPQCDQEAFTKKISAPGFRLKGSGWYETDFKTGKKKNLADGSKGESGKAESTEKKTSDKKDSPSKNSAA